MRRAVLTSLIGFAAITAAGACGGRAPAPPPPPPAPVRPVISTGRGVLTAMHDKYDDRWFKTLSLVQNNTIYGASGRETKSQWRKYIRLPGRMRIEYPPLSSHSGVLYAGDNVYIFDNGKRISAEQGQNLEFEIGMNVYAQSPAATARALDSLGFAMRPLHHGHWQGRPVWIVGATAGDTTSNQFWVDTARMLVVRAIQTEKRGTRTIHTDTHFNRYTTFDGIPIAVEVLQYRDGRLVLRSDYTDVRVNPPLPEDLFDPARWVESQPAVPPTGSDRR